MEYKTLVDRLAELAEVEPETVRTVLYHLPDVLFSLANNAWVRTPLGTFRMVRRAPYMGRNPQNGESVAVPPERVVKMKAGKRLREPCT